MQLADKLGIRELRLVAHATMADVLRSAGADSDAVQHYMRAFEEASAAQKGERHKMTGFLRRHDVVERLQEASAFVAEKTGKTLKDQFPVLELTETAK